LEASFKGGQGSTSGCRAIEEEEEEEEDSTVRSLKKVHSYSAGQEYV
jgi:hypothetical protein